MRTWAGAGGCRAECLEQTVGGLSQWAETVIRSYGQTPATHHQLLLRELEALSRGEHDRLMVQMPPGSAKSTYASMLFPAWWLAQHPRDSVIAASHTAALATYFGRRARIVVEEETQSLGYAITRHDRANGHWTTNSGGEYYAVGIHGAMIGRRADLAIIDDPVKSQLEADSLKLRDRMWDWVRSDLVPRLKPKARLILIMTRWHQDDLCGRLLAQNPDEWRCLRLPALAEQGDLLNRPPGAALWPEWEDHQALDRRRSTIGDRAWWAQYQQSPDPIRGHCSISRNSIISTLHHENLQDRWYAHEISLRRRLKERTTRTGLSASS